MAKLAIMENYDAVVDQAVTLIRTVETSALVTEWMLGGIVASFVEAQGTKKYGNRSIQTLADDLQAKGVLTDHRYPVRILYLAKQLHEKLTKEKLAAYVDRGITRTHVRALLSLPDGTVEDVMEQLFTDGKVVSTREAREIIEREATVAKAKEVEATVQAVKEEAKAEEAPMFVASEEPEGDDPAKTPKPKAEKPKPSAAEPTTKVGALKAIKDFDKSAEKTLSQVAAALEALHFAGKKGFDSDKAQKNFRTSVSNCTHLVTTLLKVLPELQEQMLHFDG
jgi:hypothetical protein